MALSNMGREPQREITETAIGLCVVAIPILGDWFAVAAQRAKPSLYFFEAMCIGLFLAFIAVVFVALVFGVFLGAHALGEAICDGLQKRGIHLRPVRRPQ